MTAPFSGMGRVRGEDRVGCRVLSTNSSPVCRLVREKLFWKSEGIHKPAPCTQALATIKNSPNDCPQIISSF